MSFTVRVIDDRGKELDAVLPVKVEIVDAKGRPAEFSGYYGARDSQVSIECSLSLNDEPGSWIVRARELASGLTAERTVTVSP